MTQSYGSLPLPARNSSADANPRAPYPSEDSESTSAARNDSSSSMTAIERSLGTYHPFFLDLRGDGETRNGNLATSAVPGKLYSSINAVVPGPYGCLGLTASAIRTR